MAATRAREHIKVRRRAAAGPAPRRAAHCTPRRATTLAALALLSLPWHPTPCIAPACPARRVVQAGGEPRCLMDFWAQKCLEEIGEAEAEGLVSGGRRLTAGRRTAASKRPSRGPAPWPFTPCPSPPSSPLASAPSPCPPRPVRPAAAAQPHHCCAHGRRHDRLPVCQPGRLHRLPGVVPDADGGQPSHAGAGAGGAAAPAARPLSDHHR